MQHGFLGLDEKFLGRFSVKADIDPASLAPTRSCLMSSSLAKTCRRALQDRPASPSLIVFSRLALGRRLSDIGPRGGYVFGKERAMMTAYTAIIEAVANTTKYSIILSPFGVRLGLPQGRARHGLPFAVRKLRWRINSVSRVERFIQECLSPTARNAHVFTTREERGAPVRPRLPRYET